MYENIFANLPVHIPQMIEVRFHLPNLIRSVSRRITAEVLSAWQSADSPDGDLVLTVTMTRVGLVPAASPQYAVTRLGNQLLRDRFGARLDESLIDTYRRGGLNATLRRINSLSNGPLNQQRVSQLSAEVVQRIMAELRHATSFSNHEHALTNVADGLADLAGQVTVQINDNAARRRQLQLNCEREQQTRNSPVADAILPRARWYAWRPWSEGPKAQQTTSASSPHGGDEVLFWEVSLRQAILEAENSLLQAIVTALTNELSTDARSLALIREGSSNAESDVHASEGVRDWGIPAGEILLNGANLTNAVVKRLWPDRNALHALIFSKYAVPETDTHTTLTDEIVTTETIVDINDVVTAIVTQELSEWTITDALRVLSESDDDLVRRICEAFRQLSERPFLGTGQDQALPRAHYAVITCAPSKSATANSFFTNWIESFSQTVDIEFNVEADPLLSDCLCCYLENFSLPLSALLVCEDYVEDHSAEDPAVNPLFTPHPDILPVKLHRAPGCEPVGNSQRESEATNVA